MFIECSGRGSVLHVHSTHCKPSKLEMGRSVARPRSEILFKPDRRVKIDEVQKTSYAKNYCKNYNNFYSYAKPMVF